MLDELSKCLKELGMYDPYAKFNIYYINFEPKFLYKLNNSAYAELIYYPYLRMIESVNDMLKCFHR